MKANFNLKGLMAAAFMLLSVSLFAQQHTVTGTVVDADNGQPLVGVAVMVSTGGGVVTDANGSYAVSASDNATLTFNTLGYIDVVETVNGRSVVNVKMTVDSKCLKKLSFSVTLARRRTSSQAQLYHLAQKNSRT